MNKTLIKNGKNDKETPGRMKIFKKFKKYVFFAGFAVFFFEECKIWLIIKRGGLSVNKTELVKALAEKHKLPKKMPLKALDAVVEIIQGSSG